jgi:hypothetical protein
MTRLESEIEEEIQRRANSGRAAARRLSALMRVIHGTLFPLYVTIIALVLLYVSYHPRLPSPALLAQFVGNPATLAPEDKERAMYEAGVAVYSLCAILFGMFGRKLQRVPHHESRFVAKAVNLFGAVLFLLVLDYCFLKKFALVALIRPLLPLSDPLTSLAIACFFAFLFYSEFRSKFMRRPLYRILITLTFAVLPGLLLMVHFGLKSVLDEPMFTYHFDAVFDSVAQVFHGKTLLIQSGASYGLYAHFLEPVFRVIGLSVGSFTFVMGALLAVAYGCMFLTLVGTIQRATVVWLSAWSVLFGSYLFFQSFSSEPYFQYRPLRLLFPALLVYAAHRWFVTASGRWLLITNVIVALAPLWNLDSGLACVLAWFGFLFVQAISSKDETPWLTRVARTLRTPLLTLGAVFLVAFVFLAVRSGRLPDVRLFYSYQQLVLLGYSLIPMPHIHPWNVVILIYGAGLAYGVDRITRGSLQRGSREVLLLSFLGFGLFIYYQGRSADSNLLFVWWPAWMILNLFFASLCRRVEVRWRSARLFRRRDATYARQIFSVIGTVDVGFLLLLGVAFSIWSATVPAALDTVVNRTPLFDARPGIVAHRAEEAKTMVHGNERPLVLSGHAGILLNAIGRSQPVDIPGMAEILMMPEVNRIENWIKSDPRALVLLDNVTFAPVLWSSRIMPVLRSELQPRQISADCELTMLARPAEAAKVITSPLSLLRLFGPQTAASVISAYTCRDAAFLQLPSGELSPPTQLGPVTLKVPFTIQFIVKPDAKQGIFAHIIGNHPGRAFDGFVVQQEADHVDSFNFSFGDGARYITPLRFDLAPDRWHWVRIVMTASDARAYVDGSLASQATTPSSTFSNSNIPVKIGDWPLGGRRFAGRVLALRIDNSAVADTFTEGEWQRTSQALSKLDWR